MAGGELAFLLEELKRKGGRGQRQRKPDEDRLVRRQPEENADGGKRERRGGKLGEPEPEDRRAHGPEPHGAELEPDDEQQHHHAELGEVQDAFDVVKLVERPEEIRADDDAGGEVAEHGAHAQDATERRGNSGGGQKHRHLDQFSLHHRLLGSRISA